MAYPLQTRYARLLEILLEAANQGDEEAQRWLKRIERHGITKGLVRDLNQKLLGWPMEACFALDEDAAKLDASFLIGSLPEDKSVHTAFSVAMLISKGALNGLMQCASTECRNFAVRSTRAKWCSDKCGGRDRGRNKRKNDRQRQML